MLNRTSWMDEFLCEYIDDTMDCSVRAAFEECVESDSRLARQVNRLRDTRQLLCGCRSQIPTGLRSRVRNRLAQCLPLIPPVRPPHTSILVGTATAIVLAAALVAGVSKYIPVPLSGLRSVSGSVTEIQVKDHWQVKRVNGRSQRVSRKFRALSSVV